MLENPQGLNYRHMDKLICPHPIREHQKIISNSVIIIAFKNMLLKPQNKEEKTKNITIMLSSKKFNILMSYAIKETESHQLLSIKPFTSQSMFKLKGT